MHDNHMSWRQLPAESRHLHLCCLLSLLRPSFSRVGSSHPQEALLCDRVLCNSFPHRQPCPEAVLRDLRFERDIRSCVHHLLLSCTPLGRHKRGIGSTPSLFAVHRRHRRHKKANLTEIRRNCRQLHGHAAAWRGQGGSHAEKAESL